MLLTSKRLGKPGVPSSFGVRTKDNIAYVYWTPSYNGGSFQSFEVWHRRADDNDYNWETFMPSGVKKKHMILLKGPATVGGHGEAYFFCVRARNNKGYSNFTNIYKVLKSSKPGEENVAEDVGQFITGNTSASVKINTKHVWHTKNSAETLLHTSLG